MATAGADNPFVDPVDVSGNRSSFAADSTLAVGRNASLTLGTDALIVLGSFFLIRSLGAVTDVVIL